MSINREAKQARIDELFPHPTEFDRIGMRYEEICEAMNIMFDGFLPRRVNPVLFLLEFGFYALHSITDGDYIEDDEDDDEGTDHPSNASMLLARAGKLTAAGKYGEAYILLKAIDYRWGRNPGQAQLSKWPFDFDELARLNDIVQPQIPEDFTK